LDVDGGGLVRIGGFLGDYDILERLERTLGQGFGSLKSDTNCEAESLNL